MKEILLTLLSQVYPGWNSLLSGGTNSANQRLWSSRSENCNVLHHCDLGLSHPQHGHLAHHLLGCHTEESPQVIAWDSQRSHHSLGDLIQVSPTFSLQHIILSIRPLSLLPFTFTSCVRIQYFEAGPANIDLLKFWNPECLMKHLLIGPICRFLFTALSLYQSHSIAWKRISTWINGWRGFCCL